MQYLLFLAFTGLVLAGCQKNETTMPESENTNYYNSGNMAVTNGAMTNSMAEMTNSAMSETNLSTP